MKNIHLSVLGSNSFMDILNEIEFNNILNSNSQSNQSTKELHIKILFVENFDRSSLLNSVIEIWYFHEFAIFESRLVSYDSGS